MKKIFALIIVATMAMSLATGCGLDNDKNNDGNVDNAVTDDNTMNNDGVITPQDSDGDGIVGDEGMNNNVGDKVGNAINNVVDGANGNTTLSKNK